MLYFSCIYINVVVFIYIYNTLLLFIYIEYFLNSKFSFKNNFHKFFIKFFFITYSAMPISSFFFLKNIIYTQIIFYDNFLILILFCIFNSYIIYFYIKNYNSLLNNNINYKYILFSANTIDCKYTIFSKLFFLILVCFSCLLNFILIFFFQIFYIF